MALFKSNFGLRCFWFRAHFFMKPDKGRLWGVRATVLLANCWRGPCVASWQRRRVVRSALRVAAPRYRRTAGGRAEALACLASLAILRVSRNCASAFVGSRRRLLLAAPSAFGEKALARRAERRRAIVLLFRGAGGGGDGLSNRTEREEPIVCASPSSGDE